jgi:hypothetical protein
MRIEGAIYPTPAATNFTHQAWCNFIKMRPEFRRPAPVQKPNPFKAGEFMTVRPAPDAAEVLVEDRVVGQVSWSMSEEPLVNVSIEPHGLILVREWATALGGEFRTDSPEPDA